MEVAHWYNSFSFVPKCEVILNLKWKDIVNLGYLVLDTYVAAFSGKVPVNSMLWINPFIFVDKDQIFDLLYEYQTLKSANDFLVDIEETLKGVDLFVSAPDIDPFLRSSFYDSLIKGQINPTSGNFWRVEEALWHIDKQLEFFHKKASSTKSLENLLFYLNCEDELFLVKKAIISEPNSLKRLEILEDAFLWKKYLLENQIYSKTGWVSVIPLVITFYLLISLL